MTLLRSRWLAEYGAPLARYRRVWPGAGIGLLAEFIGQGAQAGEGGLHFLRTLLIGPDALRSALDAAGSIANRLMPQHARGTDDAMRRFNDLRVFAAADGVRQVGEILFCRLAK